LDVSNKHACFSKQEHEDGIADMGGKIKVDVPKNVGMSLTKRVDVLCNGDVPKDIEKNIVTLCAMFKNI